MDYLVKDSTDSKKYVNPDQYNVQYKQPDFYYVSNKFVDVSLNQSDCDVYKTEEFLAKYNSENCSKIMKDPKSNKTDVDKCFQKALCENKESAIQLIKNTGKKNGSLQNENDNNSFFNVEVLQSFNLGVGILGLLSGIIYILLNKRQQ